MPDIDTLLDRCVVTVCELVDRVLLIAYVERLQDAVAVSWFLRRHRGHEAARLEALGEMSRAYVAAVERFAAHHQIPVVQFQRGQRKEDIAKPHLDRARLGKGEGVAMIGVAQEWASVFRPPAKGQRHKGRFELRRANAFVKHFYFYLWDSDFGPCFIKVCTYAPFTIRVCLNGHMWLQRQLEHSGHTLTPLDNGIAEVDDQAAMKSLCQRFGPRHIQRCFDRWMYRLPQPFTAQDRAAGYTYQLSINQLEVARTEVFDRPLHGRQFFEEAIRQNLDLGRPQKLQVILGRRVLQRRAQPPPRVRVFTDGVGPSLHVRHRHTDVKQYFKLNRALRTETTFNDTRDFDIGRKLENLPQLIALGKAINLRLLQLERLGSAPAPAASLIEGLVMPSGEPGRRAPGLRLGDPRTVALFGALSQFALIFGGFYAKQLRPLVEQHLASPYSMAQMGYDLRRLARKGLLERLAGTNRYLLTDLGRRLALVATRLYNHIFCPGLARIDPEFPDNHLQRAWRELERHLHTLIRDARIAA